LWVVLGDYEELLHAEIERRFVDGLRGGGAVVGGGAVAKLGDALEDRPLVGGVALDRFDKVGDEVIARFSSTSTSDQLSLMCWRRLTKRL
jgi:hypothetical protein